MKRRRALLLMTIFVLLLCGALGGWLYVQQQQYARNCQLIAALEHHDTRAALTLVNSGADPNTRQAPTPVPSLKLLLLQLLHRTPPPINDSPSAFLLACGSYWPTMVDNSMRWVTMEEDLPLLRAMLAHGAKVNVREGDNRAPLHNAVGRERLNTLELLLQHGADINARDVQGQTPLMWAAYNANGKIAHLLLTQGANPNAQDMAGNTVLLSILFSPFGKRLLPDLLAHGADTGLRNKNGVTALMLAQRNKRPDLVRLLTHSAK